MDIGHLRIKSGRHAGAVVVLQDAPTSVGSDPTCDIVLSDDGLAPQHFTLCHQSEGLVVTAQDGTVEIDNETEIAPGYRAVVSGEMILTLGPVRIDVTLNQLKPAPRRLFRPKAGSFFPILICAGLLIGAQEAGTESAILAAPDTPLTPELAVVQDAEPAVIVPAAVSLPVTSAEVVDVVIARLAELNLQKLTVRDGDGSIILTGVLPPSDQTNWAAFQRWYDGRWPNTVLQADQVVLDTADQRAPEFPVIQSVWSMGQTPYAIIGGTRVRVGNTVNGGWTLTAIEGTSVTVRKDGRDWRLDLIDASEASE